MHVEDELFGDPIDYADAFVAFARRLIEETDARTVHHGHTPDITVDSPTEAQGVWELNDYVEWPPHPATGSVVG